MSCPCFVAPNFSATVEDRNGQQFDELHHAESEAELRKRLQQRVDEGTLKQVASIAPYDFEKKWRRKAQTETEKAKKSYAEGKEYKFKSAIWGELKSYLRELFHGKCAYCDAHFSAVAWGDVEHYRPKAKVTDEENQEVRGPTGARHPGYFWLAYEPNNLLPSCQLCNQARGKLNRFPVAGTRAWCPTDDLEHEAPLLLNPYSHVPEDHVHFVTSSDDKDFGTVAGKTDIGRKSIIVYCLNREQLIEARRREQGRARMEVKDAFSREDRQALVRIWNEYYGGLAPFSGPALAEIRAFFDKMGVKIDCGPK